MTIGFNAVGSKLLAQIHFRVQVLDLLGVAVEQLRRAAAEFAEAPLGRLAPARMIDVGFTLA